MSAPCVYLERTASTNDAARDPALGHGALVLAETQEKGRGQRGNAWSSEPGRNLTFSLVLEPRFLPADRQFLLSEAVSLGIADALESFGLSGRIKWPNDIYLGGRKTAGILIEHDLRGMELSRSIAGIGLNVNQTGFDPAIRRPTSLALAAGHAFDRGAVLERLYRHIFLRYAQLEAGETHGLESDYHARLYRMDEPARYRTSDGESFTGTIRRVAPSGELFVEHPGGSLKSYLFKEIEFSEAE